MSDPQSRPGASFLAAGALMTMASAFGQTWFIALFSGEFRALFDLSHGAWGGIYTLATLGSALLLVQVGKLADRYKVRLLALVVMPVYACICAGMAFAPSALVLGLLILGLRFCGQGMMSHLALTGVARWFSHNRGRAIAVTAMGFSVAEATLPFLVVALAGSIAWRNVWLLAALAIVAIFLSATQWLLRRERLPQDVEQSSQSAGMLGRHWQRRDALRHWLFWALTPGLIAPPMFLTVVFFHQVHLVAEKGWSLASFAASYPFYSAVTVASVLLSGTAVDRWGSFRMLPFYLAPMAVGLITIGGLEPIWAAPLSLALFGATAGGANTILGSLWPEAYGTRHLGAIRALAVAAMVLSTAVGPGLSGWLIDHGVALERQCFGMAVYSFGMCGLFAWVSRRMRGLQARPAELHQESER